MNIYNIHDYLEYCQMENRWYLHFENELIIFTKQEKEDTQEEQYDVYKKIHVSTYKTAINNE